MRQGIAAYDDSAWRYRRAGMKDETDLELARLVARGIKRAVAGDEVGLDAELASLEIVRRARRRARGRP